MNAIHMCFNVHVNYSVNRILKLYAYIVACTSYLCLHNYLNENKTESLAGSTIQFHDSVYLAYTKIVYIAYNV